MQTWVPPVLAYFFVCLWILTSVALCRRYAPCSGTAAVQEEPSGAGWLVWSQSFNAGNPSWSCTRHPHEPMLVCLHSVAVFEAEWPVFPDLHTAGLPLPLPLVLLSHAECRFDHIRPFAAACLAAFKEHFFPAPPLAAPCSLTAHANSGIGWKMKSGQDERTRLRPGTGWSL